MKKFVFIYYGGGKPDNMSMDEVMADWGKWYQEIGDKLVDGGNPFNDGGQEVTMKGVSDIGGAENWHSNGYTIVNAENMDAAVEISKGCPMLKHNADTAVVRVYEAMPM